MRRIAVRYVPLALALVALLGYGRASAQPVPLHKGDRLRLSSSTSTPGEGVLEDWSSEGLALVSDQANRSPCLTPRSKDSKERTGGIDAEELWWEVRSGSWSGRWVS